MTARDDILRRIAAATTDLAPAGPVTRDYRGADGRTGATDAGLVELFDDRVTDYKATVQHCAAATVAETIADLLAGRGARRLVVPPGFPSHWATGIPEPAFDDPPLEVVALDRVDGVVTTCAVGIAETGTVVLDASAGQGRRALSLVPDLHVVVITVGQIVAGLPDAIVRLDPARPLTWISGPSATSDIELNRVEGVHGPRNLVVVVVS